MNQFISEMLNNGQINPVLLAPVLFVFISAILVFVFGFKKPVEPPYKKFAAADGSNKAKRKERSQKLTQNGGLAVASQEKSTEIKRKHTGQYGKKDKTIGAKKDGSPINTVAEKKIGSGTSPIKKQTLTKKEKSQSKETTEPVAENGGEWMIVTKDRKKKVEQTISTKVGEKQTQSDKGKESRKDDIRKQIREQSSKLAKTDIIEHSASNDETQVIEVTNEEITTAESSDPLASSTVEPTTLTDEGSLEETQCQQDPDVDVKSAESNNVLFDELGDAWTEAKAPRKSKKKARKE